MEGQTMAREVNRLKPKTVEAITKPGRYADGNGLYLKVTDKQKSWMFMYRWQGRWTDKGLGAAADVTLADARKAAKEARKQLDAGIKPGSAAGTAPGAAPTFGEVADRVIKAKAEGWKGDYGEKRWTYQLSRRRDDDGKLDGTGFCQKLINRPVNAVTEQDVVATLEPIWMEKPRTAELTRSMIEAVLHAAGAAAPIIPRRLKS
jgi:hypothetical protein